VVEETVEYGGGDSTITVEDSSPLFEGFVGGKDDRTALVALADDLECLELRSDSFSYRTQLHSIPKLQHYLLFITNVRWI
jgi:hypothetical protein